MQVADLAAALADGSVMGAWLRDNRGITSRSKEVGRGAFGVVLREVCPAAGRQLATKIQMARAWDAKALRDEQLGLVQLKDCPRLNVIGLLDRRLDELDGHAASVMPAGVFDLRQFEHFGNSRIRPPSGVRAAKERLTGG